MYNIHYHLHRQEYYCASVLKISEKTNIEQQIIWLNNLGKIYLKRKEYIKAASLFNASLVRYEILTKKSKEDIYHLKSVYESLLTSIKNTELLFLKNILGKETVSLGSSINHKEFLLTMRTKYKKNLDLINNKLLDWEKNENYSSFQENIKDIANLYTIIATDIKKFIKSLLTECYDTLGYPKCRYAIIGFGSLARQEMTPYSDLEFGILIIDEKEKQYFRDLTNYLHLKVLNLGETILPSMAIKSLNDYYSSNPLDNWFYDDFTPRGFAFDGLMPGACKFPLGEQDEKGSIIFELIDLPDNIVRLAQDSQLEQKHLFNVLYNATLIDGDRQLLQTYKEKIKDALYINRSMRASTFLQATLEKYDLKLGDQSKEGKLYEIKKEIYRLPSIIMEGLAIYYNLRSESSYEQIQEMLNQRYITEKGANNLKITICIAMKLRLENYLYNGRQNEKMAIMPTLGAESKMNEYCIEKFFQIADGRSVIPTLLQFYYRVIPLKHAVMTLCENNDDTLLKAYDFIDDSYKVKGIINRRLLRINLSKDCFEKAIKQNPTDIESYNYLSIIYTELGDYTLAKERLSQAEPLCKGHNKSFLTKLYHNYGNLYIRKGCFRSAEEYFNKSMVILEDIKDTKKYLYQKIKILHGLGVLNYELGKLELSERSLMEVLTSLKDEYKHYPQLDIMLTLTNLGRTYWKLSNYEKAIKFLYDAFRMAKELYGNQLHANIILPLHNLACVYTEICEYSIANRYFEYILNITPRVYIGNNPHIASVFNDYGVLLDSCGHTTEARQHYEKALQIRKIIHKDDVLNIDVISTLNNLCVQRLGNENRYLQELVEIIKVDMLKTLPDHLQLQLYHNFGVILLSLSKGREGSNYLDKALELAKELYPNQLHPIKATILDSYLQTRDGIRDFDIPDDVKEKCIEALEIRKQVYKNEPHKDMASSFNSLGVIWLNIDTNNDHNSYNLALSYFFLALTMRQRIYNGRVHPEIVDSLHNIGICFYKLGCVQLSMDYFNKSLTMSKLIYFIWDNQHFLIKRTQDQLIIIDTNKRELQVKQGISQENTTYCDVQTSNFFLTEQTKEEGLVFDVDEKEICSLIKLACYNNNYFDMINNVCKLAQIYTLYPRNSDNKSQSQFYFIKAVVLYNFAINTIKEKPEVFESDELKLIKLLRDKLVDIEQKFLAINKISSNPYPYLEVNSKHIETLKTLRDQIQRRLTNIIIKDDFSFKWWEDQQKINEIRKLHEDIAVRMKIFITELWKECIETIGKPPCKYTIIAFGSMARGEMTPYSDFEWGILLDGSEEKNKRYFKTLADLLYIKVINLGETILPAINIKPLDGLYDNITRRGFTFDGQMSRACKTPFGNQRTQDGVSRHFVSEYELLGTPKELAEYQKEKWFKKDKLLPSELYQFTLVFGDEGLARDYQKLINIILNEKFNQLLRQKRALTLLKADLESFDLNLEKQEEYGKLYEIKKDLYRLPNCIFDAIGLYYGLQQDLEPQQVKSSWAKIDEMVEKHKNLWSLEDAQKLRQLLSIITALRLNTYCKNGGQRENMSGISFTHDSNCIAETEKNIRKIFFLGDVDCLFVIYKILLRLQYWAKKFVTTSCDAVDSSLNVSYRQSLYMDGLISNRLMRYSEAETPFKNILTDNPRDIKALLQLGATLLSVGKNREAIEHYEKVIDVIVESGEDTDMYLKIEVYYQFALSCRELYDKNMVSEKYSCRIATLKKQALKYLLEAIRITRNFSLEEIMNINYANCLVLLGTICADSRKKIDFDKIEVTEDYDPENILSCYSEALDIMKKNFGQCHSSIGKIYNLMGNIYYGQGNFSDSIRYYTMAKEILISYYGYHEHPKCQEVKSNLASAYQEVFEDNRSEAKFINILKSRDMYRLILLELQAIFGKEAKHKTIAFIVWNLAEIEYELQDPDSIKHFKLAYEICESIKHDQAEKAYIKMQDALIMRESLFDLCKTIDHNQSKPLEMLILEYGAQMKTQKNYEKAKKYYLLAYNMVEIYNINYVNKLEIVNEIEDLRRNLTDSYKASTDDCASSSHGLLDKKENTQESDLKQHVSNIHNPTLKKCLFVYGNKNSTKHCTEVSTVTHPSDSSYELPTREQVKCMNKEELERHRNIIQAKIDPIGKIGFKRLEREKYNAILGYINKIIAQYPIYDEHVRYSSPFCF